MSRLLNRCPHSGQQGSILIEVLISGVILVVGIGALFAALDTQGAAAGSARASSVAASLAEADQERLRSFRVPELSNKIESRSVDVDGRTYTVDSRGDWIQDSTGGTVSCATSSSQADYLRLTSTVTPPAGTGGQPRPVQLRSLVAPPVGVFGPGQGTLAVKATGAAGQAIQGATVQIAGPTTLSDVTNALGCAVFGYVPVGDYTVQASSPGFVDPVGSPTATGSATVSENTVNLKELQLDRAASVTVNFQTKVGTAAVKAATATRLSAANGSVPGTGTDCKLDTGYRLYCPTAAQGTITATNLFPYPSPYTFYSGSCSANNPAKYDPNYFNALPGSLLVPGGSATTINVREPALDLRIQTSTAATAVKVKIKAMDAGCDQVYDLDLQTAGPTNPPSVKLPEPGLPFGNYSVCASRGTGSAIQSRSLASVALTSPNGTTLQTIDLRSGTTAAPCT